MKILFSTLFLLLIASSLCQNKTNGTEHNQTNATVTHVKEETYYVFEPFWYYVEPVYYDPIVVSYETYVEPLYVEESIEPLYDIYFRKQGEKTNIKQPKVEDLKKELKELKKTVFGNENFNTTQLRKSKKIYDSKWLLAQLKISKILALEDSLKNGKKNKPKNN